MVDDLNERTGTDIVEMAAAAAARVAAKARDVLDKYTDSPVEQCRMIMLTIQRVSGGIADGFDKSAVVLSLLASNNDLIIPKRMANAMLKATDNEVGSQDQEARFLVLTKAMEILLQVQLSLLQNSILKRDFEPGKRKLSGT